MLIYYKGFPGGSDGKQSACNAGDQGSISGLVRFPWRRKWQPTPVFLPGKPHGWRSLAGYSPEGRKKLYTTEQLHFIFQRVYHGAQGLPRWCSVSSVAQSCPTFFGPQGLQHPRLPCPSATPRACSNSCPSSWWCHLVVATRSGKQTHSEGQCR